MNAPKTPSVAIAAAGEAPGAPKKKRSVGSQSDSTPVKVFTPSDLLRVYQAASAELAANHAAYAEHRIDCQSYIAAKAALLATTHTALGKYLRARGSILQIGDI